MHLADLSPETLSRIKKSRWDRIIEKHEGPDSWDWLLKEYSPTDMIFRMAPDLNQIAARPQFMQVGEHFIKFSMLNDKQTQHISKLLSLVLRHKPEELGITLDENGWTDVTILLDKLAVKGHPITSDDFRFIVETNNKKRFAFNSDESRIRANQGHSIEVDLGYTEAQPPELLYHGTAMRFLDAILADGLKKMNRHHVHLSTDEQTAYSVGSRHGKPVVLQINAAAMAAKGHIFYQSDNGVWLTDEVPPVFIGWERGGVIDE